MIKKIIIGIILLTTLILSCQQHDQKKTSNTVKISITDNTFRYEDDTILEDLYQDIKALSNQHDCNNPSEWNFTAIGSRSCGSPSEYIAYSSKLNTTEFLEKVHFYTEQQKKYNQKWRIVSSGNVPKTPLAIKSSNGTPVFVYK